MSYRAWVRIGVKIAAVIALLAAVSPGAARAAADEPLAPMAWLIGAWQGDFQPHGADRGRPAMDFEWGPERAYVRMIGYQPSPGGGAEPEHETVFVWDPIRERIEFIGTYAGAGSEMLETGHVEVLAGGAVRLHMAVHYAAGVAMPFSDGAVAGPGGHTLNFRRTLSPSGEDGLAGTFLIERPGGAWENPHPELGMDEYPWIRSGGKPAAMPDWAQTHLAHLTANGGRWITSNADYVSEAETDEEYGMEWTWTIGRKGVRGRLFGLRDGVETGTYWELHTFWHPHERRLRAEQFGGNGAYGTGHIRIGDDGVAIIDQTFFAPDGTSSRIRHRSTHEGDVQSGGSFDYRDGEWHPRRRYVWHRQGPR